MATSIVSVMEQVRKMHTLELNSSLSFFTQFAITMTSNCKDLFSAVYQCELFKYQADCMFEEKEYRRAIFLYHKALQLFKSISKPKSKQNMLNLQQFTSDIDIRYRIYQCCIALKNDDDAMSILEGIQQKHRTPKIHYALAKLYQKLNMDKHAVSSYKEVLKACPLAIDCAIELLQLGQHPNVVISMIYVNSQLDWLIPYVNAHWLKLTKDFRKTVAAFEDLSRLANLNGNPSLLCELALCYGHAGETAAALQCFKTVHLQDPLWLQGMDVYSYLLCEDEQSDELDKISSKLFSVSELHPQPWVAIGYNAKLKGECTKAVYLAARASELENTCIQALLLKGVSIRLHGDVKTAISHLRQAMFLAPTNLHCYSELVNCYLQEKRNNEALNIAKVALDSVGCTPDALVLCARTLLAEQSSYEQATRMVDRALTISPNHKSAVEVRCAIAERQERFTDAIELLKKAVQSHGCSKFHTMLASCYFKTSKLADAVDHYNIALSLNPNAEAKEGLDRIHALEQREPFESDQETANGNEGTSGSDWNYIATL